MGDLIWTPDLAKPLSHSFTYDLGAGGWGNQELQCYTDSVDNAYIDADGRTIVLQAIAQKVDGQDHFTSARLVSKQCLSLERGYVEARLIVPQGQAIWYAFWLLPSKPFQWPNEGEVDIAEGWNGKLENGNCLHWGHFTPEHGDRHRVRYHPIASTQGQHGHTYGFCWSPEGLLWFFDGQPSMRAEVPKGLRPFAQWQVMLNIAMGGNVMNYARPAVPSTHEMRIQSLQIRSAPPGGWQGFAQAWQRAPMGNTM